MVDRGGVEATTFRLKAIDSTNDMVAPGYNISWRPHEPLPKSWVATSRSSRIGAYAARLFIVLTWVWSPHFNSCFYFGLQGDKSSTRSKAGRSNPAVFLTTNRKYCSHLLHVLRHFRYSGSTGMTLIYSFTVFI